MTLAQHGMTSPFLCAVCLLSLLTPVIAQNNIIYVSPNGSNNHNGLSPNAPLRTLRRASQLYYLNSNTVDTILLQRNATYINDPLTVTLTSLPSTDKPNKPFTVSSYGNMSLPRPLLQHARTINSVAIACVHIMQDIMNILQRSVTVSQLHFSGCARGLVIAGSTNPTQPTSNLYFHHNIFQDIRTPFFSYNPANPKWSPAILLDGGYFQNMTIQYNIAARIDLFFDSKASFVRGMNLDSNTVQQCSGNCYGLGRGVNMLLQNSVFLRDVSTRLFLYGTTDVIVGGLTGTNSLINNDFNQRGEYASGPDGCAFDFETAATGFLVKGNTFSKSYGSGIMIFGHSSTSKNISITNNIFDRSGCTQARADQGGVAIMCPNGHIPTGTLSENTFFKCQHSSAPAIYISPQVKHCGDGLIRKNNNIYNTTLQRNQQMVNEPQINFNPPSPTDQALSGISYVVATCSTVNATLRYTLNGKRPDENDRIVPGQGIAVEWPGPILNINVRAFHPSNKMLPSITNGALIPLNYGLGRAAPDVPLSPGPNGMECGRGVSGSLDVFNVTTGVLGGWAIDYMGGAMPVTLQVLLDGDVVGVCLANTYRPDLVPAGVAPDAYHGFSYLLEENVLKRLSGRNESHVLSLLAVGTPSSIVPVGFGAGAHSSHVVCRSGICSICSEESAEDV